MNGVSTQSESKSAAPATIVALTGFMGSGKTTVGRELATQLGWEFVDLDAVIEAAERQTIREIFREAGEPAFRALEHQALRNFLSETRAPAVLATGGGTFVEDDNAALLRHPAVVTVFLEMPVDDLLSRCTSEEEQSGEKLRPLAADEVSFRELYARRLPKYRHADIVVDGARKDPAEIAREIVAALRALAR